MSRDKDPECRGLLINETPNAIQVMKRGGNAQWWWIPRSQIGYLRKTKRDDGSVDIVFTVPEWLLESKQAWELCP